MINEIIGLPYARFSPYLKFFRRNKRNFLLTLSLSSKFLSKTKYRFLKLSWKIRRRRLHIWNHPEKGTFTSMRSPNRRTIIIFNPTQTNSNEPQPISTISLTSLNSFTNRFPNGSQHAPSAYRACITLALSMLLTSFKIQPHVCTS